MSDGSNNLAVSGRMDQGTRDEVAAAPAGRYVHEPFASGEFNAPDLNVEPPGIDDTVTTDAPVSGAMTPGDESASGSSDAVPAEQGVFGQFKAGEFDAPEGGDEPPVIDDTATTNMHVSDDLGVGNDNASHEGDAIPVEKGVFGEFVVGDFETAEPEMPILEISESPEVLVSPTENPSDSIFETGFREAFLSGNPEVFEFAEQNVDGDQDDLGFDPGDMIADLPEDDAMVEPQTDYSLPDIDAKADELDAFMDMFFVDSEEDAMVVDELTGFDSSDWDGGGIF